MPTVREEDKVNEGGAHRGNAVRRRRQRFGRCVHKPRRPRTVSDQQDLGEGRGHGFPSEPPEGIDLRFQNSGPQD